MDDRPQPGPFGEQPPAGEPTRGGSAPDEPVPGALAPGERPASEYPPDERRGSGLFGLPAIIAILVVGAATKTVTGPGGFVLAAAGILILFLVIGLAMTIAKRG
jgi:hypothetical protein